MDESIRIKKLKFTKFFRYFYVRLNKVLSSIFIFHSYKLLRKGIFPSYEHKELFNIINGKCDSIIDVGFNKGQFSLIASNLILDVPIFGFEPLQNLSAPFLKYFKKRFKGRTLELFPYALSDKEEKKEFYVTEKSDCSSLLLPSEIGIKYEPQFLKVKKMMSVNTKRLDDILLSNPKFNELNESLLKIDTQGSELSVLKGSKLILARRIKYIYVEVSDIEHYQNQDKSSEIVKFLDNFGFVNIYKFNLSYEKKGLSYGDFLFEKLR